MSRRSWLLLVTVALAGVVAWLVLGAGDGDGEPGAGDRAVLHAPSRARGTTVPAAPGRARRPAIPWSAAPARADGSVTIAGTVLEVGSSAPVGGVEVVFTSAAGEETTTADADGTYRLELPAGVYRAFVRDDAVLSVGRMDRVRLPGMPSPDTANAPDEALLPVVVATRDASGIDLSVMRGGTIRGRVVDRAGRPVANAMLRAIGNAVRPALGSDLAETDRDGTFELRVPAGMYQLDAQHARYAGVLGGGAVHVDAGDVVERELTVVPGCVVSGRVVDARGRPAPEGAIERQYGASDLEFTPAGRIETDGTFWWATETEGDVVLRAWPWKSPPAPARRFACRDGARFADVVFQLPERAPDIAGVLVDRDGVPVPFAFIDLAPLDPGGFGQQERTDAEGRWAVYAMPAGRYAVTAHAPGRGVVSQTVRSPETDVRLQLSGTGRLEGTTTLLEDGSFELVLGACLDGATIPVPRDQRLVAVQSNRFVVDDVPACDLSFVAVWRGDAKPGRVTVPAGGVARVEVAIGPARAKVVHGVVRDRDGHPVEGARVTATYEAHVASAVSDRGGRFTVDAASGARIVAYAEGRSGATEVGLANVDAEEVEITVDELAED